jgi:hypothetical protein
MNEMIAWAQELGPVELLFDGAMHFLTSFPVGLIFFLFLLAILSLICGERIKVRHPFFWSLTIAAASCLIDLDHLGPFFGGPVSRCFHWPAMAALATIFFLASIFWGVILVIGDKEEASNLVEVLAGLGGMTAALALHIARDYYPWLLPRDSYVIIFSGTILMVLLLVLDMRAALTRFAPQKAEL